MTSTAGSHQVQGWSAAPRSTQLSSELSGSLAGEDELQDLSQEDAQELRAFQEKRRWFEGKLKLLEDLPPTYPFILPNLIPSSSDPSDFAYANEAGLPYRLPSIDTLRLWQAERDTLEEEVLAFDGGDLGRMKEKTREVTLVPLTKPSTHAVAITLDLILLIDRLLTLLRRRWDLLELIALRLQWDGLRWKVMRECARLTEDVRSFVNGEGRWKLPETGHIAVTAIGDELVTPVKPAQPTMMTFQGAPEPNSSSSQGFPTAAHSTLPRPPGTPPSPTALFSPHAFPSPTIRSHPQSLSARHRTLVSTHLKRSSAVLDEMIDIAGPLKDLGGLHGPLRQSEQGKDGGGALPEELLDMQDELELLCEDVKGRVAWCKELEEQRERLVMSLITRARSQANRVISELRDSLSQPASSAQHKILAEALQQAEAFLPAPLDRSFPRPKHSAYPDVETHTADIVNTLSAAHKSSKEQCSVSQDGVGWYLRLFSTRSHLADQLAGLDAVLPDFESGLDELVKTREGCVGGSSSARQAYLDSSPGHIAKLSSLTPEISRQVHLLEVSGMTYKSTFQPPTSIRPALEEIVYCDILCDTAEKRAGEGLALLRKAGSELSQVKQDMLVLPVELKLEGDLSVLISELAEVRGRIESGMDSVAWKRDGGEVATDLTLVEGLRQAVEGCNDKWMAVVYAWAELDCVRREVGARDLGDTDSGMDEVELAMGDVKRIMDLLERVAEQAKVVQMAEKEAVSLLQRLHAVSASYAREGDDGEEQVDSVQGLERDVRGWVEGLAERVPFVSAAPADIDNASLVKGEDHSTRSSPQKTSTSLYQPTSVPTGNTPNLSALDRAVRDRVNELSSRVSTALSSLTRSVRADPDIEGDTPAPVNEHHLSADSSAASSPHAPEDEDVFGSQAAHLRVTTSTSTIRTSSSAAQIISPLSHIRSLRKRIRSLAITDIVFPSSSAMSRTPSLQRLPGPDSVESVSSVLRQVADEAETLRVRVSGGGMDEEMKAIGKLKDELSSAMAFLPRLEALAAFSDRSKACDEVFGRLMDVLEATEAESPVVMSESKADATAATASMQEAEEAAMAVENDRRVISEMKRLKAIWADLSSSPKQQHGGTDDSISVNSSDHPTPASSVPPSPQVSRIPIPIAKPRIGSSLGIRSNLSGANGMTGMRSTSNPFPRLSVTTENYRNRTVSTSGDISAKKRVDSLASTRSGLLVSGSGSASTPKPRSVSGLGNGSTPTRIPRLSMMSPTSAAGSSLKPEIVRAREASMPIHPSSVKAKERESAKRRISEDKAYISDPKSTLDQAVGKIINKLKMSVPIVPVNIAGADEWKDQSGRYWIGAHGRAKLCFCRILRSRTVMVRVGGGWMELSRFLMDHFADALWPTPLEEHGHSTLPPITPMRNGGIAYDSTAAEEPLSVNTGSSLDHTPVQKGSSDHEPAPASKAVAATTASLAADHNPMTPVKRGNLSKSSSGSLVHAPRTSIPLSRSSSFFSPLHSPHTPSASGGDGPTNVSGPASPLTPLHFLKKASESPPVREREKERIGAGRRSILGREGL